MTVRREGGCEEGGWLLGGRVAVTRGLAVRREGDH